MKILISLFSIEKIVNLNSNGCPLLNLLAYNFNIVRHTKRSINIHLSKLFYHKIVYKLNQNIKIDIISQKIISGN